MRKITKSRKSYIVVKNKVRKKVYDKLQKPIVYLPSDYGLSDKLTGKNVKICVVDSGCPKHRDIKIDADKTSFCDKGNSVYDKTGHSTLVSGIIGAKNKNTITGLAPSSRIYFAKVVDDIGECNFNSIVAAILWSIVKEVDIILLALGTKFDYNVFHDSIKKAYNSGIIIIASAGNDILKNDIDYPAGYKEVFSVAALVRNKGDNNKIREKVDFVLPNKGRFTTYIDNSYIRATGPSILSAQVAAVSSLLIEKMRNQKYSGHIPKKVYSDLLQIL